MTEWNPDLYLKFKKERTQPAKDLISRIEKDNPARIIDIGCGTGNSTAELKKRWPNAEIVGIDRSPHMIQKAKTDYPDIKWELSDASGNLKSLGSFDVVFSNAAIQWMPNHNQLLEKLFNMLNKGGVLAVQTPYTPQMPIKTAINQTASEENWKIYFDDMDNGLEYQNLSYYYDVLSPLTNEIYLWETHYNHVLSSHKAIIEWYSSTGMRPYLARLNEAEQEKFKEAVLLKIGKEYKIQNDGNVLFEFRRLFFIAYQLK